MHEVVLVGGCAHIPRLQAAFKGAFGKPPTVAKEKDSAARGAAVQVRCWCCHEGGAHNGKVHRAGPCGLIANLRLARTPAYCCGPAHPCT